MGVEKVRLQDPEKDTKIQDKVRQNMIDMYEKQLLNAERNMESIPEMIRYRRELLEINKEAQLIQMKKFKKLNFDYEYEKDPEFTKLMIKKNAILNLMDNLEYESKINKLQDQYDDIKSKVEVLREKISIEKEQMGE